jgi:hypothetical protein
MVKLKKRKGIILKKKGGMAKKRKKGPLGAMIKEIWRGLPVGVKAGIVGTGAGIVYSKARKIFEGGGKCRPGDKRRKCKGSNRGRAGKQWRKKFHPWYKK